MKDKIFVMHVCKNSKCNNAWIDEDLTNAKTNPPQWKFCKECCEKYGFINSKSPPKKKLSIKQKETIEKYKFNKRKKSTLRHLFEEENS
jgi:hypothetical protein